MEGKYITLGTMTQEQFNRLSPMMKQYLKIKREHSGCLLLFRLGDFYELFFDDALLVSGVLGLTLTGRDCGLDFRAPMCGVPYHAVNTYVNDLIKKGYHVAICEQTTDPALSKGLVEREVVKIITPGTVTDEGILDDKDNNFIAAVYSTDGKIGYAYSDLSTGSFYCGESDGHGALENIKNELFKLTPKEIIIPEKMADKALVDFLKGSFYTHEVTQKFFNPTKNLRLVISHFKAATAEALGLSGMDNAVCASGALLNYFADTQKHVMKHIFKLNVVRSTEYMHLDDFTISNLELLNPLNRLGTRSDTLIGTLDETQTPMGSRKLKSWISRPLLDRNKIESRLNAVDELRSDKMRLDAIKSELSGMGDIERLCSRLGATAYSAINPKQLIMLKNAIIKTERIKELLSGMQSDSMRRLYNMLESETELCSLIEDAIVDDPPATAREGGFIRSGFDKTVDECRKISGDGKQWLQELEEKERNETGIRTLRIGYNRVFGYYFEVSKSFMSAVPDRFIRKQTLANSERYFTDELKALEEKALSSEENCIARELQLFEKIIDLVNVSLTSLLRNADLISVLDVFQSLANVAEHNNYVRPTINDSGIIEIIGCRHPVVERGMKGAFNPNDAILNDETDRILVITGPNMAGKSTYMRQTALAVIMAHIGSFVPATRADICIVDRLFTRVGASDNLASGQSTFMVEMSEMACILNSATQKSLLILDEIGRGTSTYDGLSIAWAVLEHIANKLKAKTMFATHYHELIALENEFDCLKNYSVAVREVGDNIVFLHKIVSGGADRSFGIQVAGLAGLPDEVIMRAKSILRQHEGALDNSQANKAYDPEEKEREIAAKEMYAFVSSINPDEMSPKDAMNTLYTMKKMLVVK